MFEIERIAQMQDIRWRQDFRKWASIFQRLQIER
jgi:hypothetical protein